MSAGTLGELQGPAALLCQGWLTGRPKAQIAPLAGPQPVNTPGRAASGRTVVVPDEKTEDRLPRGRQPWFDVSVVAEPRVVVPGGTSEDQSVYTAGFPVSHSFARRASCIQGHPPSGFYRKKRSRSPRKYEATLSKGELIFIARIQAPLPQSPGPDS